MQIGFFVFFIELYAFLIRSAALLACFIMVAGSLLLCACTSTIERNHDYDYYKKLVDGYVIDKSSSGAQIKKNHYYEPLQLGSAGAKLSVSSDRYESTFNVTVKNEPIQTFFQNISYSTPYNIFVSPQLNYKLTFSMKNATVPSVIRAAHKLYHFSYSINGNDYFIQPNKIETAIFTINHLNNVRDGSTETRVYAAASLSGSSSTGGGKETNASDNTNHSTRIYTENRDNFWKDLHDNLVLLISSANDSFTDPQVKQDQPTNTAGNVPEHASVSINKENGLIMLRAYPDDIDKVRQYLILSNLIEKRQVIIEARIVEVQLSKQFSYGIDWNLFKIESHAVSNATLPGSGNILTLAAHYGSGFNTVINYLSNQGKVSILSSPRIASLNNQQAVIKIGTENYYVTNVTSNDNSSSASSVVTSTLDLKPFFSGVLLDVTPQISNDGEIILHLHPVITRITTKQSIIIVNGQKNELPLASSEVRESDSNVIADSGKMIVIGGLVGKTSSVNRSRIPFLESVPHRRFFNDIFSSKNDLSDNVELVILLRPIVTK